MTVIVATSWESQTYMAADSRTSSGWTHTDNATKLIRTPYGCVGLTGRVRHRNVLESELRKPRAVRNMREALALAESIAEALKAQGWKREHQDRIPQIEDMGILVATERGKIFSISGDFAVIEHPLFAADGSGSMVALGALQVLRDCGHDPRESARVAAKAACSHVSSCGGRVRVRRVQ